MTSLHVICGLGPPQSKILATPMPNPPTIMRWSNIPCKLELRHTRIRDIVKSKTRKSVTGFSEEALQFFSVEPER